MEETKKVKMDLENLSREELIDLAETLNECVDDLEKESNAYRKWWHEYQDKYNGLRTAIKSIIKLTER